jgi:hypothetical protein
MLLAELLFPRETDEGIDTILFIQLLVAYWASADPTKDCFLKKWPLRPCYVGLSLGV